MDRLITYPGAIPLDTDILNTEKNGLVGLGKLAHAILGDGPFLNALGCTPTSPASMNVTVAPGQIYSLQNIDGTAYGSLSADTSHTILKQGILLDAVQLSCPAPTTSGQSINYLVQVTYQDTDADPVVLPYYNASNPSQAYSGPNNTGTAQNTRRNGVCAVNVKAGVAAATGSQTTPAPDSGYTGAYVVTVAYGATSIAAGNISVYAGAPFLTDKLINKITQTQADARYAALAGLASQVFNVANASQSSHAVNLGQFNNSLAASGYQKLPGGLILQWGTLAVSGSGTTTATGTVTFPVAFPTAFAAGSATTTNAANTSGDRVICQVNGALNTMGITLDTNGVIAINQAQNISWIAIGY